MVTLAVVLPAVFLAVILNLLFVLGLCRAAAAQPPIPQEIAGEIGSLRCQGMLGEIHLLQESGAVKRRVARADCN